MRAVECNKACTPVKPNVRISIPAIIATLLAAGAARPVVIETRTGVSGIPTRAEEYRVSESFPVAAVPACMPALTRAPNGDMLVAFSTEWEPFPAGGVLKLTISRDKGKT